MASLLEQFIYIREDGEQKARWVQLSKAMAQHSKDAESAEKEAETHPSKRMKRELLQKASGHRKEVKDILKQLSGWHPHDA